MPRRLMLAIALAALLPSCAAPAESEEPTTDRLEAGLLPRLVIRGEPVARVPLTERMAALKVPGVSVAVFKEGRIEWARGYGLADIESNRPVTGETLFQAASISKPVAALAGLRLAERDSLDIDADVNSVLTSWKIPENEFTSEEKVTLRRILNHTAGTTVWGFPGYSRTETIPSTVEVLQGSGNTDPITVFKTPGESWRYSGGGYTVGQLLIQNVAGRAFPQIMQELVLEPAGMKSSTYEQPLPENRRALAASGYRRDGTKVEGDWHVYPEMAAAGLWTTPSDLARFAMAIQRSRSGEPGSLLGESLIREMLQPGMNNHGLGPGISEDGLRFGHGGANEGFRCQFTAFIEGGNGVAVMTNSDSGGGLAQEIILTIGSEYGWPGIEPQEKVVLQLEPGSYEAVSGRYRFEEMGVVNISYEDDRLLAHLPGSGPPLELLAESDTEFFDRDEGRSVSFQVEDGRISGVLFGGQLKGTRID